MSKDFKIWSFYHWRLFFLVIFWGFMHERKNGRQPLSTGSWLKPVLKVSLLDRFVAQIGAKGHYLLVPIWATNWCKRRDLYNRFEPQTGAKGLAHARNPFSAGSWLKLVIKVSYEPVLKPCGFPAMSWTLEPVHLVWVRSSTGAKAPGRSKRKPYFLLVSKLKKTEEEGA
jgi:hypothetical protein